MLPLTTLFSPKSMFTGVMRQHLCETFVATSTHVHHTKASIGRNLQAPPTTYYYIQLCTQHLCCLWLLLFLVTYTVLSYTNTSKSKITISPYTLSQFISFNRIKISVRLMVIASFDNYLMFVNTKEEINWAMDQNIHSLRHILK